MEQAEQTEEAAVTQEKDKVLPQEPGDHYPEHFTLEEVAVVVEALNKTEPVLDKVVPVVQEAAGPAEEAALTVISQWLELQEAQILEGVEEVAAGVLVISFEEMAALVSF